MLRIQKRDLSWYDSSSAGGGTSWVPSAMEPEETDETCCEEKIPEGVAG